MQLLIVLITLLAPIGSLRAQGNENVTAASPTFEASTAREVAIGAGSTAAVTTGSSGPQSSPDSALPSGAGPFDLLPRNRSFFGPGMLPIRAPAQLRCGLIEDGSARARCETRAKAMSKAGRG